MSDTRFSLASVPTVNSTWLLTNDESTLMIPCIVTPALQQGEVPYTACDLPCKSHHSALFFCFTIWAKLSGPWLLSYNALITLAWPCYDKRPSRNKKIHCMVSTFVYFNKLLLFIIPLLIHDNTKRVKWQDPVKYSIISL